MKKVLEDSGYLRMLQEDNESDRMENIKELLNDMQQCVKMTRRQISTITGGRIIYGQACMRKY
ncbi:MAG: hypothetical protein ACLVJ6_13015 [Merdibacter sp.]